MELPDSNRKFVLELCDRLCLNHDLYVEFNEHPERVIERYKDPDTETSVILFALRKSLNVQSLKSHWENAIACACRDVAIVIPD